MLEKQKERVMNRLQAKANVYSHSTHHKQQYNIIQTTQTTIQTTTQTTQTQTVTGIVTDVRGVSQDGGGYDLSIAE